MNQEAIEQEWEFIREQREMLRDSGAQEIFGALEGFEHAFEKNTENFSVMCMDEGCTGEGTHLGGSGCLIPEEQLITELKEAGITEFTTHEGCGAWALANPDLKTPEEKEVGVIEWGKNIAGKLDVPHRHIQLDEMKRPADLHNAFYAIYDGTGHFNRDNVPGMEAGFVTSPKYFTSAKENLELAVNIAFGAHGFGEKFSPEDPFVLIGIGNADNKANLIADMREVQNKFESGRVTIDFIQI